MDALVSALPLTVSVCAAALAWWQTATRGRSLAHRMQELEQVVHSESRANEALRRALQELEQAATVDRLTGAWNRRRFEEAAAAEMALARRRRSPVSLALLDIDHFKRVNDNHGHPAGDVVLAGCAATVRAELRISDILVRWGGEEFLVLLPATGLAGAVVLAEKLRRTVENQHLEEVGNITVSVGVAEHLPGETLAAWTDRADRALYRAKAAGRNRVQCDETSPPAGLVTPGNVLELVWDEAYASGNQMIDAQHELLFRSSNALLAAVISGQPAVEVNLRLETLMAHAAQHFHDEEQLLRTSGYPDLEGHLAAHNRLLKEANDLRLGARGGDIDFGRLVTYLATNLVKGHLLVEDRHYFEHIERIARKSPSPS